MYKCSPETLCPVAQDAFLSKPWSASLKADSRNHQALKTLSWSSLLSLYLPRHTRWPKRPRRLHRQQLADLLSSAPGCQLLGRYKRRRPLSTAVSRFTAPLHKCGPWTPFQGDSKARRLDHTADSEPRQIRVRDVDEDLRETMPDEKGGVQLECSASGEPHSDSAEIPLPAEESMCCEIALDVFEDDIEDMFRLWTVLEECAAVQTAPACKRRVGPCKIQTGHEQGVAILARKQGDHDCKKARGVDRASDRQPLGPHPEGKLRSGR